jgi:hypothetical protein
VVVIVVIVVAVMVVLVVVVCYVFGERADPPLGGTKENTQK